MSGVAAANTRPARSIAMWPTLAAATIGCVLLGGCEPAYENWPMPEELTRDGSGRLADIIPGDWEVICYTTPYADIVEEVRSGPAKAGLPANYASNVRDTYLLEGEYVFALLSGRKQLRTLYLDKGLHEKVNFFLRGARCHKRDQARYEIKTTTTPYGPSTRITINSGSEE